MRRDDFHSINAPRSCGHHLRRFFLLPTHARMILIPFRAAFSGSRIVLRQVSPESESIYDLIMLLHNHCNGDWSGLAKEAGVGYGEVQKFLEYATQFLGNLGNYKGFGDVKFIPRCAPEVIQTIASKIPEGKNLCDRCISAMYADTKRSGLMHFGFPGEGHMSCYYPNSPAIQKQEITQVGEFLAKKKLFPENTRLRKTKDGNYEVLIASGLSKPNANPDVSTVFNNGDVTWLIEEGPLKGTRLTLVFADHQEQMAKACVNIKKAGQYAANETQKDMMDNYAHSFSSGSLIAFKESQKLWVKDLGPDVECNIGFIETYRDPAGVRGEWEGFVAMVNKERTAAFQRLVAAAPSMIPKLPWSSDFEKPVFHSPDFTSLEVLSFCGSGIPAGINIPNDDQIRQDYGFKNVSLGNVLGAKETNEPVPFIHPSDLTFYTENRDPAFEVQVGIHELLGHGTGKLLRETSRGIYNFNHSYPPVSPVTNKPITTHYAPDETYSSLFGNLASSYEECRAECVAMALSCDFEILKIFGFGNGEIDLNSKAGDVLYTSYLSMARAGIMALEYWDPKSRKWGQIHMQARFGILRTFLDAGDEFCVLRHTKPDLSDLTIKLDRNKILTHGRPAVEKVLQKLHIYKSCGDVQSARQLYDEMTGVEGDFWAKEIRSVVLAKKRPRKVFVQANTVEKDGKVELREYEATMEGMVRSWAERGV